MFDTHRIDKYERCEPEGSSVRGWYKIKVIDKLPRLGSFLSASRQIKYLGFVFLKHVTCLRSVI